MMNYNDLKPAAISIKILGSGCARCQTLEKSARQVVDEMKLNAVVEKEHNVQKIIEYGVWKLPALVINEKVIFSGLVPTQIELKKIIIQNI